MTSPGTSCRAEFPAGLPSEVRALPLSLGVRQEPAQTNEDWLRSYGTGGLACCSAPTFLPLSPHGRGNELFRHSANELFFPHPVETLRCPAPLPRETLLWVSGVTPADKEAEFGMQSLELGSCHFCYQHFVRSFLFKPRLPRLCNGEVLY